MNTVLAALAGAAGLLACGGVVGAPAGPDPGAAGSEAGGAPGARIEVQRPAGTGDPFRFVALYEGDRHDDALAYRLAVVRDGRAGRSQSVQSGAFAAAPGRVDTLSSAAVNAGPGDRVEARLTITRGDDVVAEEAHTEVLPESP